MERLLSLLGTRPAARATVWTGVKVKAQRILSIAALTLGVISFPSVGSAIVCRNLQTQTTYESAEGCNLGDREIPPTASAAAAASQSTRNASTVSSSLAVSGQTFMKLLLGSTRADAEMAGAKGLRPDTESRYRGDVVNSIYLPADFEGTHKRTLYFSPEFGLYRVRWQIGNPMHNDRLYAEELFQRWKSLLQEFKRANPSAILSSASIPDIHDLNLETLQECPKGPPNIHEKMAQLSEDELEKLLESLGAVRGETCPEKCLAVAMMCGAVKHFKAEFRFPDDVQVGLYSSTLEDGALVLVVVFSNYRIAPAMLKNRHR
jgi:hypothetical protein